MSTTQPTTEPLRILAETCRAAAALPFEVSPFDRSRPMLSRAQVDLLRPAIVEVRRQLDADPHDNPLKVAYRASASAYNDLVEVVSHSYLGCSAADLAEYADRLSAVL